MEYRVAELASIAGVGVDTIRFYQSRGLIPPPVRRGRFAIYDVAHLERIRRIRTLLDSGFSLAQIRRLVEGETADPASESGDERGLLAALAAESVGEGTLSRVELAIETGVPEALLASAIQAGLIQPLEIRGQERFSRSDLEMVVAALGLLGTGMPLDGLLQLAARHTEDVDRLAEQAIDLFDDHVRKPLGEDEEGVARAFERLLPQATRIVALHFQRTLVARALARLRGRGEEGALEKALEITQAARLEVQWR